MKSPRIPLFYVLPKIHKGISPPPGRPIISGCGSLLEPLAIFVDWILQPAVSRIEYLIRDTRDFINKVENFILEEDMIFLTMDVKSLYTIIPHEEARSVVEEIIYDQQVVSCPSTFIMQLVDLFLEKNYFCFEDKFYFQIKGVAMGCSVLKI